MDIEFVVPTPKKEKKDEAKKPENASSESASTRPKLEVGVANPNKIVPPTANESKLAAMEPDDPRVLLSQQLSTLPGITGQRGADMAVNADRALRNINIQAQREMELARRKAAREAQGKGKKRRKKRR